MDVGEWLRDLGLSKYEAAFRNNGIDELVLPHLTVEDLKELGVGAPGGQYSGFWPGSNDRRVQSQPLSRSASSENSSQRDRIREDGLVLLQRQPKVIPDGVGRHDRFYDDGDWARYVAFTVLPPAHGATGLDAHEARQTLGRDRRSVRVPPGSRLLRAQAWCALNPFVPGLVDQDGGGERRDGDHSSSIIAASSSMY